jgi:hypothetical protein
MSTNSSPVKGHHNTCLASILGSVDFLRFHEILINIYASHMRLRLCILQGSDIRNELNELSGLVDSMSEMMQLATQLQYIRLFRSRAWLMFGCVYVLYICATLNVAWIGIYCYLLLMCSVWYFTCNERFHASCDQVNETTTTRHLLDSLTNEVTLLSTHHDQQHDEILAVIEAAQFVTKQFHRM